MREMRKTLRRIMSSTSSGDLWGFEVAIRVENKEEEGDQRTELFCVNAKEKGRNGICFVLPTH